MENIPTQETTEALARAEKTLRDVFEKQHDNGLRAVYLWGSIVTGGFNPEKSDVDAIGIVTKDATVSEADFTETLEASGFNEFHIRLVSEDELRTGEANGKNPITHVIFPRVLLFDMKNWHKVAGENLAVEDFTDDAPTVHEVVNVQLDKIERDTWESFDNVEPALFEYYLKGLLRLIHYKQIERGIDEPFSMDTLENNANAFEQEIIDIFKISKEHDHDKVSVAGHTETLNNFIARFFEEYRD